MTALNRFDLSGRVAVVTGGAGLLGMQHARALLECGATVYIADIHEALAQDRALALQEEFGKKTRALKLDVCSSASIENALKNILSVSQAVHILINNAALDPKVSSTGNKLQSRLENFPLNQWNKELEVGLTGAFLCSQVCGSWMADHGGGIILNIASDLSVIAPDQRIYRQENLKDEEQPVKPVTYSVIKTGLIGLTRYLAAYWANKNIRVNALSPGGVYAGQPEEFVTKLTSLIPLGRMAREDEYRSAIQFLCSEASSYLTGQNIVMDGGRSIL